MSFDQEKAIQLYEKMLRIRRFEEKANEMYLSGSIGGTVHTYIGQEAVGVGVCSCLQEGDQIVSNHRGHGHAISKGVDVKPMMAELFGKVTGCCKGMGGSMHIADVSRGMLGANGIVAAGLPIASGAGLSAKLLKNDKVIICFFGDGAANHGNFHESVNMAANWKLPVVFVCENNLYAVSVPFSRATPVASIADRAPGYGIPGVSVDGMDVEAVAKAAKTAIDRARRGEGPSLIECRTYRFFGHSRSDPAYGTYRTQEELEEWKKRDPLLTYPIKAKIPKEAQDEIEKRVEKELDEAVKFAKESEDPTLEQAKSYLYA